MSQPRWAPDFEVIVDGGAADAWRAIKVRGELDSGTCQSLLQVFDETLAEPGLQMLMLDLQGVTFIDSTGTRSIIVMERAADDREVSLQVIAPPEPVTELLRTAGAAGRLMPGSEATGAFAGEEFDERVEIELASDPLSPGKARGEVRELLAPRLSEDDLARAVLLTSELVTNAVIHPRTALETPVGVRITIYSGGVRVEVEDAGQGFELPIKVKPGPRGGQGLFLVDTCAANWGALRALTERGPRFRVWFELQSGVARDLASNGS